MFDGMEIDIKRGQFISGRKVLAKTLRTSEQKVRSRIALLLKHKKITQKSTNKYSIITVLKYDYYQNDRNILTSREPAENQQRTTNNKVNKVNKVIGDKSQKDMSWKKPYNENSHQDDLPEVDAETGEVKKEPKKEKHVCYTVFNLFKEITGQYPLNWNVNKSQRIACENLVQEHGIEKIKIALRFYMENKDTEMCPQILSPWDLDTKWKKLVSFKNKNDL